MTSSVCDRAKALAPSESTLPSALLGTWLLCRIVEVDAAGDVTGEPYGARPSGRLIYGPGNAMAVVIREHDSATAVAYAGEAVQTGENLIRHVVHVGLPPYTTDQLRYVRLTDGTDLVLATDIVGRPRTELHWTRG